MTLARVHRTATPFHLDFAFPNAGVMKSTTEPSRPSTVGHRLLERPRSYLLASFVVWKLLLFAIVLVTPAPAYDTSTAVLFQAGSSSFEPAQQSFLDQLADRFTRWDGIYFTKVAQRGYINEQEWAFSWGFTQLLGRVAQGAYCSVT